MLFRDVFSRLSHTANMPLLLVIVLATSQSAAQQWSLESSVEQAMSTSPELKQATAEIGAREADTNLSGMWPDPEIGFRVDNKMGQDDGAGGYDLTDVLIRQSIPVSRIKHQESPA